MSYVLEILNSSGTKVAQLSEQECSIQIRRVINEEWSCHITYPIPISGQGEDKRSFFELFKARAKIIDTEDSTDYVTFVLQKPEIIRAGNKLELSVEGEHISIDRLRTEIVTEHLDFQDVAPSVILTSILSHSAYYSSGTVGPTAVVSLKLSWESVLSALQKLLEVCGSEYDVDEVNSEIDILSALGSTSKYIHIRPERNLKSIRRTKFNRDVINKLYGIGGGEPPATMAGARHVVYFKSSQVITVYHGKLCPENDSWNGYRIKIATGALAGNTYPIVDSTRGTTIGGTLDTLEVTGDISGLNALDKIIICDSSNNEVDFIRAGTSISGYGSFEDVYKNTRFGDTVNLVETPALDGYFTAGLCQDWLKVGLPTLSANTTNYKYGTKSQKVIGASAGDGISQEVSVTTGRYYSISSDVYHEAESMQMIITMDGVDYPLPPLTSTQTGWQTIKAKLKANASTITVKLVQYGAAAATFYIDAVLVAETKLVDGKLIEKRFVKNCEQIELWFEAFDRLMETKDPKVEYQANFIDLHQISPRDYPFEEIDIGDTVILTDDEIGISAVSARVTEINYNPFRPELTEHTISTAG